MTGVEELLNSAAILVLTNLERLGFRWDITERDTFRIWPSDRLTPGLIEAIRAHRDDLVRLGKLADSGVVVRRQVFEAQWRSRASDRMPAFLFKSNVPYGKGACFSCGDALERFRWGRCWRCALSWRLALRLPVEIEVGSALDAAKEVA